MLHLISGFLDCIQASLAFAALQSAQKALHRQMPCTFTYCKMVPTVILCFSAFRFLLFYIAFCCTESASEADAALVCIWQDGYHVQNGLPLAAVVQGQPHDEEVWAAGTT